MDLGADGDQFPAVGQAKRKQQRDCPALGRVISPAECGEGRNSEIACPLDCPYNPFAPANYEVFLDLEGKVANQLSVMLAREAGPTLLNEMRSAIDRNDLFTMQALLAWRIYGQGLLAKWTEEGRFDEWKNDDRVMLDCLATTRPALIEFHEVRDEMSCVAVDLLRPDEGTFFAIDRGVASRTGRHDVILGWVYDIPAGKKIAVSAREVPAVGGLMPNEVLERTLQHLGADETKRELWIQENMILLSEAFAATNTCLRNQQSALVRSESGASEYAFPRGALTSIVEALASQPRVLDFPMSRNEANLVAVILAEDQDRQSPGVAEVEGTLVLMDESLSIHSHSEQLLARCRGFVEGLGLPVVFHANSPSALPPEPPCQDRDLVPPEFLKNIETTRTNARVRLAPPKLLPAFPAYLSPSFPDTPHSLLDGATPREATQDPALRTRLQALMKGYFRDCDKRRRKGEDIDVGPLALELGLQEMVFAAPPLGEERDIEDEFPEIVLTPPPPQPLLQGEELNRRVENVVGSDESLQEHRIRLIFVFEAMKEMESGFNFDERSILFGVVTAMIGAMHPEPPEGFLPNTARMAEWYRDRISSGEPGERMDEYLERIAYETRQPEVVGAAYRMIHYQFEAGSLKIRSKRLEQLNTAACAAIWEAAHWPVKLDPD